MTNSTAHLTEDAHAESRASGRSVLLAVLGPFAAIALAEALVLLLGGRASGFDGPLLWVVLLGSAAWAARVMGKQFPRATLIVPLYFVLLVILLFVFGLVLDCTFRPGGCDL